MKKPLVGIFSLALMGGFLLAESIDPPENHVNWMKKAGKATGAIKKGEDVEANAKDLAETFTRVGRFYTKRGLETGVKTSADAVTAANAIAKAAADNDKDGISAGAKSLGAACKGCHDVHREKISDTENKIKW
ncbi:MAG: hypothetical protein ABI972_05125 [Acidobacteriota bacterium]